MALHLVVIDALNLIRRIHAVQKEEADIDQTIRVCSQAVTKIIKQSQPTHIIAVFDHHQQQRGWRAELLPNYKEGRKPMPEALAAGMGQIQDALWELGVDSLLSDGDEADDLIATIAMKVANRNEQVTIISTDKGYCQLLQPTLRIRDYFQQRWLDLDFVQQEFGLKPEQLADYWGLAGISSSKITGIPGVGPKAAKEILTEYGDIESAFKANSLVEKYRKKLDEHIETARISKQIAALKTDLPLGFNLQEIRYDIHE
ncbi:flap endonuclease Xni [Aliivibrio kagoshimensis]|uniref:flap endonuclease Xni n=1 Tax=Aliivibrio kagoshimensis TaxID=2910230 RepID=UPI003D0E4491